MKKEDKYFAIVFQIALLLGMTISISYFIYKDSSLPVGTEVMIVNQSSNNQSSVGFIARGLELFGKLIFGSKGFVSATDTVSCPDGRVVCDSGNSTGNNCLCIPTATCPTGTDISCNGGTCNCVSTTSLNSADSAGAYTCPMSYSGSLCQEYPASSCKQFCRQDCIPTTREHTTSCKLGTCYNSVEGTCTPNSPQGACTDNGGTWDGSDTLANLPQCKQGCCILGDQANFVTSGQCSRDAALKGINIGGIWHPEITDELSCIIKSTTQETGACVFDNVPKNDCKFTTRADCLQTHGAFHSGWLCSNPSLNTHCEAEASIACSTSGDEVYWYDSCGNKENIYDLYKKNELKDNGVVVSKNDSCNIASGGNGLANQANCGNCNRLFGSACGAKTASQHLSENANVVCRDLRCTDENGNIRQNGESWCVFQGAIGVRDDRGSDTVGSRYFRKTCKDGVITTDPCADYRNEECVETKNPTSTGGTISTAACRINLGKLCYGYNDNTEDIKNNCAKNPDCFVKHTQVGDKFYFDMCVPKYKPGFDLSQTSSTSSGICSYATQKCTVVEVKGLGGWSCKANCECRTATFAKQMNDLCMSLGDCGTQANYLGKVTDNYEITKGGSYDPSITLDQTYKDAVSKYAEEGRYSGQFISGDTWKAFYGILGTGNLIDPSNPNGISASLYQIPGMIGVGALAGLFAAGYFAAPVGMASTGISDTIGAASGSIGAAAGAAGGALAGAAIGFAVVSLLLSWTGVGAGLDPAISDALMATGASAGALIGLNFMAAGTTTGTTIGAGGGLFGGFGAGMGAMAAIAAVAWIVIVVVIIIIIVMMIIGIGKVRKTEYKFICDPWEAPTGGKDCGKCGSDGLPCSAYSCSSLGQTCQIINEGTENASCVNVNPNDVTPPVITPATFLLPSGYTTETTQNGIRIKSDSSDGCIRDAYGSVPFGIMLDEAGQCAKSSNHTDSYDVMDSRLDSGLYLQNHSLNLELPTADDLGLESFNPNASADLNYYVRCKDKSGNINSNEYVVNFCIAPGNDTTPPAIVMRSPAIETVAADATFVDAAVFTNEPADCNWDTSDNNYTLMQNNFTCMNSFSDRTLYGWRCNAQLPFPITTNQTSIYIRCMDKPWLGDNLSSRNSDTRSYLFNITRSTPLNIDSISPDNETIIWPSEPKTLQIVARTSGGYNGEAACGIKYKDAQDYADMSDIWTSVNTQTLTAWYSGDALLPVRCRDLIGNIAERTASFKVKLDTEPPLVTRAYSISESLNIITDKFASCFYSTDPYDQCGFDIDNASIMSGTSTLVHTTSLDSGKTYYVKCKDTFGHYSGDCNIVVRGGT